MAVRWAEMSWEEMVGKGGVEAESEDGDGVEEVILTARRARVVSWMPKRRNDSAIWVWCQWVAMNESTG